VAPRSGAIYIAHSVSCGEEIGLISSRGAAKSRMFFPHVLFITLHPLLFQECPHLILVADASMMFLLILDISDHSVHTGPANAETRKAFLPRKLRTALVNGWLIWIMSFSGQSTFEMSPLRGSTFADRFPTAHAVGYVDCAAPRRLRDLRNDLDSVAAQHKRASNLRTIPVPPHSTKS